MSTASDLQPAVSVLMPVYNAERYLREAVQSVLSQDLVNIELIAVNDGSKDGSLEILESFARRDSRMRVISRPNTGLSIALNEALAASRATLIARMDADDVCLPNRLSTQVAYLEAHPECVCVGSKVLWIDPLGRPIRRYPDVTSHEEIERFHFEHRHSALIHPSIMMRRATLEAVGPYRRDMEPAEDLDLFLRLAEVGRVANIEQVLLKYRMHDASVSRSRIREQVRKCGIVVSEARARRGMASDAAADQAATAPVVPEGESAAEWAGRRHWWAREARSSGFYRTATAMSLEVLRRQPLKLASWYLLASAGFGPMSDWIARRLQQPARRRSDIAGGSGEGGA